MFLMIIPGIDQFEAETDQTHVSPAGTTGLAVC